MSDTVIHPRVRYAIALVMAFCTDMEPKRPNGAKCTLLSLYNSGLMEDYAIADDEAVIALREMVALGHARCDDAGVYRITDDGLVWLRVESEIRHSADKAREDASHGE